MHREPGGVGKNPCNTGCACRGKKKGERASERATDGRTDGRTGRSSSSRVRHRSSRPLAGICKIIRLFVLLWRRRSFPTVVSSSIGREAQAVLFTVVLVLAREEPGRGKNEQASRWRHPFSLYHVGSRCGPSARQWRYCFFFFFCLCPLRDLVRVDFFSFRTSFIAIGVQCL